MAAASATTPAATATRRLNSRAIEFILLPPLTEQPAARETHASADRLRLCLRSKHSRVSTSMGRSICAAESLPRGGEPCEGPPRRGSSSRLVVRALADPQVDAVAVGQPAPGLRALREHVVPEPARRELPRDRAHAAVVLPDLRPRLGQEVSDHVRDHAGRPERWRRWRRRRRRWRWWWRRW